MRAPVAEYRDSYWNPHLNLPSRPYQTWPTPGPCGLGRPQGYDNSECQKAMQCSSKLCSFPGSPGLLKSSHLLQAGSFLPMDPSFPLVLGRRDLHGSSALGHGKGHRVHALGQYARLDPDNSRLGGWDTQGQTWLQVQYGLLTSNHDSIPHTWWYLYVVQTRIWE
jgi:hypothetical protein